MNKKSTSKPRLSNQELPPDPPSIVPPVAPPGRFVFWPAISVVGLVLGWLLVNGATARKNYLAFSSWARHDAIYKGTWTNDQEGLTESPKPGESIWLNVEMADGTFDGEIHSEKLCSRLPFNYLLFDGCCC